MKILLKCLLNQKINVKKLKPETFTKHDSRKLKLLIHDTQSSDLNFVRFKEFKQERKNTINIADLESLFNLLESCRW